MRQKKANKQGKATYSIYLTASSVDNLQPFLSSAGVPFSTVFDSALANLYESISMMALSTFAKSVDNLTLREISTISNHIKKYFFSQGFLPSVPVAPGGVSGSAGSDLQGS